MNKRQKKILCTLIGSAFILSMAEAAAQEQEYNLDEYVVTANRIPLKQAETAASVKVITRDEIEKSGYTRVPEILEKAGLSIFDSGSAGYSQSSVFINGDDRVLVLVDGRKINKENDLGGGKMKLNLNLLPSVKSIERIEIVRGPASSLYGSDAAGGVINIITRKATANETALEMQGGNWGMRNYSLRTEGRENGFGYFITAERRELDHFEYKDARTGQVKRMPNSAVDEDAISVRLDKELSEGRSLSLYLEYINSKKGYFLAPPGYPYHFPTSYEVNRNNTADLTYRWKNRTGADGYFKVYYSSDLREIPNYMEGYPSAVDKWSVTSRTTGTDWQDNWRITDRYDLVGGVSWRQVNVDIPKGGIFNKKIENSALFLENRWRLPADWTLTAGMRHDDYNLFGGQSTVRLTANRKINNDTNIFASWGQVFRTPNIEQLYSTGVPRGNPNLRPETGDTVMIGVNTKLAGNTKLQASIFSSRLDDAIVRVSTNVVGVPYSFDNVSKQKRQGLNLDLTRQLSPLWNISAGYAYVQVQQKVQGAANYTDDPENNQPNGYRFSADYSGGKWDAGLTLRGATGLSRAAFTTSSYWVVDLSAKYKISPDLIASFKVYNLANTAYEVRGVTAPNPIGFYPMAARHFYLGLERRM
ncbi:MAG TPA: TonB-dependent receptor [Methylomusa anaerophila]|uniref:Vitamin B12 transporter BtuB n=1 Tax=Methylomusa anaerophila TaxID=1930071 RepID=A0A348AEE6_9FIRM|nr:TonB-dependent receptor [Methylomusa anaerophila]BBB89444.1 vitamin B12 transporter BtuB precursor [Methylomusa anaerophila]HML89678.1 TonB-dependent receptor [Methylomusa anaerophila]